MLHFWCNFCVTVAQKWPFQEGLVPSSYFLHRNKLDSLFFIHLQSGHLPGTLVTIMLWDNNETFCTSALHTQKAPLIFVVLEMVFLGNPKILNGKAQQPLPVDIVVCMIYNNNWQYKYCVIQSYHSQVHVVLSILRDLAMWYILPNYVGFVLSNLFFEHLQQCECLKSQCILFYG